MLSVSFCVSVESVDSDELEDVVSSVDAEVSDDGVSFVVESCCVVLSPASDPVDAVEPFPVLALSVPPVGWLSVLAVGFAVLVSVIGA